MNMKDVEFKAEDAALEAVSRLLSECKILSKEDTSNENAECPCEDVEAAAIGFVEGNTEFLVETLGFSGEDPEDAIMHKVCELAATIDVRLKFARTRELVMCCKGIRLANRNIQWCVKNEDRLLSEVTAMGMDFREVCDTVREYMDLLAD